MLAARLYGPRDLRIEEINVPKVKPGWVLVKTMYVGICGTDKAFYTGRYKLFKSPIVPGHEVVGVVVEGPAAVKGKLVVSEINLIVDWSHPCVRTGLYTHCPPEVRKVLGITVDGGMAEYFVTRVEALHVVEGLEPLKAVYVEPLAAVLRAFRLEPLRPRTNVAIVGSGPIALLAAQVARLQGGLVTVFVRRDSPKKRVFEKLGFHVEYVEEVLERIEDVKWNGLGYEVVVEATGSPQGLDIAVAIASPLATVHVKSTHGLHTCFDQTVAVVKELRLIASRCGTWREFEDAIAMLKSGDIHVEVGPVYKLKNAKEAFEASLERKHFKVVVEA